MGLQDLNDMLLGHMRWAMTKETFAPYSSSELLIKYSKYLSISQKEDLVKNIKWCLEKIKLEQQDLSQENKNKNFAIWEKTISTLESKINLEPLTY